MTERPPPVFVGFAGCTSLGYGCEATLAAMAAGLSNFVQTEVRGPVGDPAVAARVAILEPGAPRGERLARLASLAAEDLSSFLEPLTADPIPLVVGLPADLSDEDGRRLHAALDAISSVRLVPGWACRHGRAAGFAALDAAYRLISAGAAPLVLVGGIDSLCASDTIRALLGTDRLLAPGTEGTIPGEAGMFALIADGHHPSASVGNAVSLAGLALGRSSTPFIRQQRVSADGLAATFRQLREHGCGKVEQVIGAHSGEGYFARSFSYAYLREVELMPEPLAVELIADRVGDVGAAAALVGLAFATLFMTPGWRAGPERRVLVYSESDTGEVGAAVLQGAPSTWRRPMVQPTDRRYSP